ncbi:MAG: protein BmrU [Ruminococcaceae bacterium]|nr:protein BmrU [Oscillospiraceae bacterium]
MDHIFIVNPHAGNGSNAQTLIPAIQAAAGSCGIIPTIKQTTAAGHAIQLATHYASQGTPVRLYAVGGDGTLNELFNGAWRFPNAEVAAIPCGSGNDFVRSFGTPAHFLDIPAAITGHAVPIDLMETDSGIGVSITSVGLDADVAYSIPKYRHIPLLGGSMAYNIAIVERLLKPLGKHVRITLDGQQHDGAYLIAAVCNGRYYGGGFFAAPIAQLTDGLLDIVLVSKINRLLIANIIGKYKKGIHLQNGQLTGHFQRVMRYTRAKSVEIQPLDKPDIVLNIDGECAPAPRLFAQVLPLAGRFVLPRGLAPTGVLSLA